MTVNVEVKRVCDTTTTEGESEGEKPRGGAVDLLKVGRNVQEVAGCAGNMAAEGGRVGEVSGRER